MEFASVVASVVALRLKAKGSWARQEQEQV